jgi:parallel beta-helix repeat protein
VSVGLTDHEVIIMPGSIVKVLVPVVGMTVALWSFPLGAQAAPTATHVTCGQTLTSSTRLANSLRDCPGDGLVVGADNITIDLAGHSIGGVNSPGSEGIADDGHARVRIRNGTISNFFLNGIGLRGAPSSEISNVMIRRIGAGGGENDASAGVLVKNSPHSSVSSSTVMNDVSAFQSDGIDVLSSAGTTISGDRITDNAWNGIFVLASPRTRIIGNTLDGNQNQGTEVNSGSDGALLAGNRARNNVSNGLVVGAVSDVVIQGNTLSGNGDSGLFFFDLLNSRVSRNRAGGNALGIDLEGGQHGSTGNRVTDNNASQNRHAGIVVANGANDNIIAANVSNANQGAPDDGGGIVLAAVTGNKVFANVANRNRDVGIGVFEDEPGDSTGNVLRANVADFNRAHGISAVRGTVDGGGNVAHGNTPLPNCLGVSCT